MASYEGEFLSRFSFLLCCYFFYVRILEREREDERERAERLRALERWAPLNQQPRNFAHSRAGGNLGGGVVIWAGDFVRVSHSDVN